MYVFSGVVNVHCDIPNLMYFLCFTYFVQHHELLDYRECFGVAEQLQILFQVVDDRLNIVSVLMPYRRY